MKTFDQAGVPVIIFGEVKNKIVRFVFNFISYFLTNTELSQINHVRFFDFLDLKVDNL